MCGDWGGGGSSGVNHLAIMVLFSGIRIISTDTKPDKCTLIFAEKISGKNTGKSTCLLSRCILGHSVLKKNRNFEQEIPHGGKTNGSCHADRAQYVIRNL